MELYPLKFKPVYKEKIWGGNRLETHFKRNIPDNKIGESWEVTAHSNGISVVENGPLTGIKLTELMKKAPESILGYIRNKKQGNKFPLLVKLLDANKNLSVQVHPDNNYAFKNEGEPGKTEMWYVIDAEPGAELIYGLEPGTTRQDISREIDRGNLAKHLNQVNVETGDIFFIPSGTIHAIGEGILLAEIQQNSDTTYRVYDWNRTGKDGKPRKLHIDKALEVIHFNKKSVQAKRKPLISKHGDYTRSFLAACPHFVTEKIDIKNNYSLNPEGKRFYIILVLTGKGVLNYKNYRYKLKSGETVFLPASLDKMTIKGEITLLKSYLPENKEEIINRLKNLGFNNKEINELAGIKTWEKEQI